MSISITGFLQATRAAALGVAVALTGGLAGCRYERVVAVRGGLYGLPGARGGVQVDESAAPTEEQIAARRERMNNPLGYPTPENMDPQTLTVRTASGAVKPVSRNPRELLLHLRRGLVQNDRDLLAAILSDRTLEAYEREGKPADEAVDFLLRNRDEIARLLSLLPMGELTPGQVQRNVGSSAFRLEVPGRVMDPPLRYTKIDYVYEQDGCWLLLIS